MVNALRPTTSIHSSGNVQCFYMWNDAKWDSSHILKHSITSTAQSDMNIIYNTPTLRSTVYYLRIFLETQRLGTRSALTREYIRTISWISVIINFSSRDYRTSKYSVHSEYSFFFSGFMKVNHIK